MTTLILLPWPNNGLAPNARRDYHAKAALVKAARFEAKVLTLDQAARAKFPDGASLAMSLVFCRPSQRKYDLDGLISRMKASLDGVCDALGVNDNRVWQITGAWGEPYKGGRVELRIEVMHP